MRSDGLGCWRRARSGVSLWRCVCWRLPTSRLRGRCPPTCIKASIVTTLHALAGDSRSAFARNKTVLGDGWSPAALIRLLREWCSEAGMGTQFNDYLVARKECMDFAFQELDRLEIEALRYVSLCGLSTCLELLNQIWRCNQCAGKGDGIRDANFYSSGNALLPSLLA